MAAQDNGLVFGDRVVVKMPNAEEEMGIIRFVGDTLFSEGTWVGVELDRPSGKNDGSVNGVAYFACKPKYGLFVRRHLVTKAPPQQVSDSRNRTLTPWQRRQRRLRKKQRSTSRQAEDMSDSSRNSRRTPIKDLSDSSRNSRRTPMKDWRDSSPREANSRAGDSPIAFSSREQELLTELAHYKSVAERREQKLLQEHASDIQHLNAGAQRKELELLAELSTAKSELSRCEREGQLGQQQELGSRSELYNLTAQLEAAESYARAKEEDHELASREKDKLVADKMELKAAQEQELSAHRKNMGELAAELKAAETNACAKPQEQELSAYRKTMGELAEKLKAAEAIARSKTEEHELASRDKDKLVADNMELKAATSARERYQEQELSAHRKAMGEVTEELKAAEIIAREKTEDHESESRDMHNIKLLEMTSSAQVKAQEQELSEHRKATGKLTEELTVADANSREMTEELAVLVKSMSDANDVARSSIEEHVAKMNAVHAGVKIKEQELLSELKSAEERLHKCEGQLQQKTQQLQATALARAQEEEGVANLQMALKSGELATVSPLVEDSASRLFVSGQITALAWKVCSTWISSTGSNLPAEADIRISACPFNLPALPEGTSTFPTGIVKLDVPCFGGILDAIMELFYIADVFLCAEKMKIRIPEYKIDTFIKGKMQIVRDMTGAARARTDCIGQNLEAVARLESFANDFEGINEKSIRHLDDWKTFVGSHVASGWEEKLAFEHVLGNFGFDEAFATSLRNSEVEVIDPKTGAKEVANWQHRGLRWVSKALGGYKPVGCLTDVVNLVFAMMDYKPADVALGLSEARVIDVIMEFKRCIENQDLRKLWIPNYVMLDCESDDMLVWCLLTCVHEKRGTSLSVLAQLPEHEDAERIANYLRNTLGCVVIRDSDSQNLKAILHYWDEMLETPQEKEARLEAAKQAADERAALAKAEAALAEKTNSSTAPEETPQEKVARLKVAKQAADEKAAAAKAKAALAQKTNSSKAPEAQPSTPLGIEAVSKDSDKSQRLAKLRSQAKHGLEQASKDGKLAKALEKYPRSRQAVDKDSDQTQRLAKLRAQAKRGLVEASKDGKLAKALEKYPRSRQAVDKDSVQTQRLAKLRSQAKRGLVEASKDGKLAKALEKYPRSRQAVSKDSDQTQRLAKLRSQAVQGLAKASKDGRLAKALKKSRWSHQARINKDPQRLAKLRSQAYQGVVKANKDGRLAKAVKKCPSSCQAQAMHLPVLTPSGGGKWVLEKLVAPDSRSAAAQRLRSHGFSVNQLLQLCIQKDIEDTATTKDIVHDIVIPDTESKQACYMNSQFMIEQGGPRVATKLVSHAWGSPFLSTVLNIVVDASGLSSFRLAKHLHEHKRAQEKHKNPESHAKVNSNGLASPPPLWPLNKQKVEGLIEVLGKIDPRVLEKTYWLCVFGVNEHKKSSKPTDRDYEIDKFDEVIHMMTRGVMVSLDADLSSLNRVWVLGEIAQAMKNTVVHFRAGCGLSKEFEQKLLAIVRKHDECNRQGRTFALGRELALLPPVEDCQCTSKDDKKMILDKIDRSVTLAAFEEFVWCLTDLSFGMCWRLQSESMLNETSQALARIQDLEMNCSWLPNIDFSGVSALGMGNRLLAKLKSLTRLSISFEGVQSAKCSSGSGIPELKGLLDDCKDLPKLKCLELNMSRTSMIKDEVIAKGVGKLQRLKTLGIEVEDCSDLQSIKDLGAATRNMDSLGAAFLNAKGTKILEEEITSSFKTEIWLSYVTPSGVVREKQKSAPDIDFSESEKFVVRKEVTPSSFSQAAQRLRSRGFSVRQLLQMCIEKDIDEKLTTAEVVRDIVILETASEKDCYMKSQFMMKHGGPKDAQKLCSHGWGSPFLSTVLNIVVDAAGLSSFRLAKLIHEREVESLNGSTGKAVSVVMHEGHSLWPLTKSKVKDLVQALSSLDRAILDKTYWLCVFGVNEHKAICGVCFDCKLSTPEEFRAPCCKCDKGTRKKFNPCPCGSLKYQVGDPNFEIDKFEEVVQMMPEGIMVSLDHDLSALTRVWVLAEVAQAMKMTSVHFRAACGLNEKLVKKLTGILAKQRESSVQERRFVPGREEALLPPIEECQCTSEKDKQMILDKIDQSVTLKAFDGFVWCLTDLSFGMCWRMAPESMPDKVAQALARIQDLEMNLTWLSDVDFTGLEALGIGNHFLKGLTALTRLSVSFEGVKSGNTSGIPGLESLFTDCRDLPNLKCLEINMSRTNISSDEALASGVRSLSSLKALSVEFEDCLKLQSVAAFADATNKTPSLYGTYLNIKGTALQDEEVAKSFKKPLSYVAPNGSKRKTSSWPFQDKAKKKSAAVTIQKHARGMNTRTRLDGKKVSVKGTGLNHKVSKLDGSVAERRSSKAVQRLSQANAEYRERIHEAGSAGKDLKAWDDEVKAKRHQLAEESELERARKQEQIQAENRQVHRRLSHAQSRVDTGIDHAKKSRHSHLQSIKETTGHQDPNESF